MVKTDTASDNLFADTVAPFAPAVRKKLSGVRNLILSAAAKTEGVGAVLQALRWGQFSFLTPETGSGSTIRIDGLRSDNRKLAIYFHCQSGLVSQFRELYPKTFTYEGERAIVLDATEPLPKAELEHCISLALTHHLRKKPATQKKARRAHATASHHHRHRSGPG